MRKFLLFVLFVSLGSIATAQYQWQRNHFAPQKTGLQDNPKKFDPDRLVWGGNVGAWFGSVTYVELSPLVGYRVTDNFVAGVGISYRYFRFKYPNNFVLQDHMYGGSIFGRQYIGDFLFAHAELEGINYTYYDYLTDKSLRQWWPTPLIGGGYFGGGDGLVFYTSILYALNSSDERSPYHQQPFLMRIGFIMR